MNPLILAIAIVAIPIVVLTVLRINAAIVFLSLCLGEVLVMFVSTDATSTVGILNSTGRADTGMVSFGLLMVPAILTAFCMIGTVKGKLTQALNILPAIAVGALALLLAKPLFSTAMQSGIESTVVWEQLQGLQTIIVSASALISLFFLWIQRPKSGGGKAGKEEGKKHK